MLLITSLDLEELKDSLLDLGLFVHILCTNKKKNADIDIDKYRSLIELYSDKINRVLRKYSPHTDSLVVSIEKFINCISKNVINDIGVNSCFIDINQSLSIFDSVQKDLNTLFEYASLNNFTEEDYEFILNPVIQAINQILLFSDESISDNDVEFF